MRHFPRTTLGRAEALRRAMLAYIDDTSDPPQCLPAYGRLSLWSAKGLLGSERAIGAMR